MNSYASNWSQTSSNGVEWDLTIPDPVVNSPQPIDNNKVILTFCEELKGENGLYKVLDNLGSGKCGEVFRILKMGTDKEFALKAAKGKGIQYLHKERDILQLLDGVDGFLRIHDQFQLNSDAEATVLDLQGTDLNKLKEMLAFSALRGQ